MGRHARDDEPVPHPQDRGGAPGGRRPDEPRAAGRGEASGAHPVAGTPKRSSISDAFGIAGRGAARGDSSGYFVSGGGEPAGSARRGEASGSYPVAGRGEASGSYPVAGRGEAPAGRRGEASGSYPVAGRGEAPAGRRGEVSGSYPVVGHGEAPAGRRGETSGSHPVAGRGEAPAGRRGEASGSYPAASRSEAPVGRRGEATGSHPVAERGKSSRATRRGEASGSYPVAGLGEAPAGRRGEATGSHPAASRSETPAGRRGEATGSHPAAERGESPRATRRGEATGANPVAGRGEATGAHPARRGEGGGRRRVKAAPARPAESAAERTEVITRHDEASGDYPITARTAGKTEDTGSQRTLEREEAPESTSRRGRRRREAAEDETPGRLRAPGRTDATAPSGKSENTGSHRTLGKGDATGSHRIVGKKAPRRRIAGWPIACAVLAALIGLGVIGWNWADSELNSRAEAQAASCSGGTSQMRILVTPSVQKPLTASADRWNQAATVVHGQCVHVVIEAKPSAQVLDALVGRTNLDAIGGLPAAWLPESSYWVSELTTKKPELIGSPAQSVANARSADYPFIGLTGQGIDDTVLRAAQTFREYLEQPAQQADFAAAGIKST
ncbi:hypothetical protein [Amycolatopsis sp. RTGN1]|uniref:hypothetical protein n=1 Tax=Amycolatopsis ponsaeliensis TaxID=2992142 RepID=UPI00254AD402|nr:hypothetical protein [Amycolatopsis sp. RTGN1]